jgi:nitrate/nitrite-specific signal transduction histidine kinase
MQLQVFRILQEALSNVRKHGQAHHVWITFTNEIDHTAMVSSSVFNIDLADNSAMVTTP